MAKKHSVAPVNEKSAESGGRKPAARPAAAKPPAAKNRPAAPAAPAGPAAKPVLAQEEIGKVAGSVWHVLSERGELTVAAVKKAVDAPGDLVAAAVGWLAREGKLEFTTSGRTVKVSLKWQSRVRRGE